MMHFELNFVPATHELAYDYNEIKIIFFIINLILSFYTIFLVSRNFNKEIIKSV